MVHRVSWSSNLSQPKPCGDLVPQTWQARLLVVVGSADASASDLQGAHWALWRRLGVVWGVTGHLLAATRMQLFSSQEITCGLVFGELMKELWLGDMLLKAVIFCGLPGGRVSCP